MNQNDSPPAPYEPKVVAFCCTYCAYTAGDLAGSMRLEYAPNVRVVKTLCTGKIDAVLLLRAFEDGADAVYVAGCALGDCHFLEGNLQAIQTVAHVKKLLAEIGLEPERLEFFHVPASAGPLFAQRANEMTARARRLGPNPLRRSMREPAGGKLAREPDPHPPLPAARLGKLVREQERSAVVRGSPDPALTTDSPPATGRPAVGGFGEVGRPAPNESPFSRRACPPRSPRDPIP